MYDVSTQTNRTVQYKIDDLKHLRSQINSQDKDIVIYEQLLTFFLQMSMDDTFDTTTEILDRDPDNRKSVERAGKQGAGTRRDNNQGRNCTVRGSWPECMEQGIQGK